MKHRPVFNIWNTAFLFGLGLEFLYDSDTSFIGFRFLIGPFTGWLGFRDDSLNRIMGGK